jgi:hypothetical protein
VIASLNVTFWSFTLLADKIKGLQHSKIGRGLWIASKGPGIERNQAASPVYSEHRDLDHI